MTIRPGVRGPVLFIPIGPKADKAPPRCPLLGYIVIMNISNTVVRISVLNLITIALVNLLVTLFGAAIPQGFLYGYLGGIALVLALGAVLPFSQRLTR